MILVPAAMAPWRFLVYATRWFTGLIGQTAPKWRYQIRNLRWKSWVPGVMLIARLAVSAYYIALLGGAAIILVMAAVLSVMALAVMWSIVVVATAAEWIVHAVGAVRTRHAV